MGRKSETKELIESIRALKEKYPEEDIEGKICKELGITPLLLPGDASRITLFKNQVIASFGTDHEMPFNDIEEGLVQAMQLDGQAALKDVLEQMPVETPTSREDGVALKNKGRVKKTL
jgi:hypothetical protein